MQTGGVGDPSREVTTVSIGGRVGGPTSIQNVETRKDLVQTSFVVLFWSSPLVLNLAAQRVAALRNHPAAGTDGAPGLHVVSRDLLPECHRHSGIRLRRRRRSTPLP